MSSDIELAAEAVKRVIIASAPERLDDFNQIWTEHNPRIVFTRDKKGFTLESGPWRSVLFNHKTMCQIWLLGFAVQRALHAYSPILISSQLFRLPLSKLDFDNNERLLGLEEEFQGLIQLVKQLERTDSIDDFNWPKGIPYPNGRKPTDINGMMVFDLLCMCAAYCFLHELKHVVFKSSKLDIDPIEEELMCDEFARNFLSAQIETYSVRSGYPLEAIRSKRSMSIALCSTLLLVLTPRNSWNGSISHPSVFLRIRAFANNANISDNDYFWVYFTCLLLTQLSITEFDKKLTVVLNQKNFFFSVLSQIEARNDAGRSN